MQIFIFGLIVFFLQYLAIISYGVTGITGIFNILVGWHLLSLFFCIIGFLAALYLKPKKQEKPLKKWQQKILRILSISILMLFIWQGYWFLVACLSISMLLAWGTRILQGTTDEK